MFSCDLISMSFMEGSNGFLNTFAKGIKLYVVGSEELLNVGNC